MKLTFFEGTWFFFFFLFEGEKSCLLYQSYFGISSDISVACCGSSISSIQLMMLLNAGAEEIVVAFDRQFKEKNDEEFRHLITTDEIFARVYISSLFLGSKSTGHAQQATHDCSVTTETPLYMQ